MANETAEQKIYNRLAQAPSFHPAGAKLFVPDWTLEPGDVVTVQSDGEDYSVPIYSLDLTWNGQSRVDIQSTGNQKREPLSALKRKEYNSGRRSYGLRQQQEELEEEFQEFETWQTQTDEVIGTYAGQFVEILGDGTAQNPGRLTIAETAIEQTASDATITAQASGILLDEDGHPILDEHGHYQYDPNAGETTLTARINTNATNISAKVSQTDLNTTLASYLQINAFSTELASTLDDGDSTLAAKVITLVNKNTNTSTVIIEADQIDLNGVVTSTEMDTRLLNVDLLFASTGYGGTLYLTGNTSGTAISANGKITAGSVMATSMQAGSFRITTGDETYAEYTGKSVKVGNYSVPNVSVLANLTGGLTSVDLPDAISEITTTGYTPPTDGNIGFRYRTVGNSTYQQVNFNIADTAYYQSHVGIKTLSVTGGTDEGSITDYNNLSADVVTVVSDGYYIVAADGNDNVSHAYKKFHVPQGQAVTPLVAKGTWNNGQITFTAGTTGEATASVDLGISVASVEDQQAPNRHARVTVNDSSSPTGETQELFLTYTSWDYPSAHHRRIQLRSGSTGGSVVAYADVDATDMYEDGWGDAYGQCNPPYAGDDENFSVQIPSPSVGRSTDYGFTFSKDSTPSANGYAYVTYDGDDRVVGKIGIGNYYTAGQGSVSASLDTYTGTLPSGATTLVSGGKYVLNKIANGTSTPQSYYQVPSTQARTATSLSDVSVSTTSAQPNVTVTYDSGNSTVLPINVDATAVWTDGYQEGQGSSYTKRTAIATLNGITLTPEDAGTTTSHNLALIYDDLSRSTLSVSVDATSIIEEQRSATSLSQTITLLSSQKGESTHYTTINYDNSSTQSNFPVVVDATNVYAQGVSDGSNVSIEGTKDYGTVTGKGTYTINPSSGYDAMRAAKITVNVPTIYNNYNYSSAITSNGSTSITLPSGYATKKVTFNVDVPSASHNITAGSVSVQTGSTSGRKNAGSISGQSVYNARNSGYIFFTASCGGTNQGFYISINA